MSRPAKVTKIKNALLTRTTVLGNTDKRFMHLCSDLLKQLNSEGLAKIAEDADLSISTLRRMIDLTETETGEEYNPSSDTIERILRSFNAECSFAELDHVQAKFRNKPKTHA